MPTPRQGTDLPEPVIISFGSGLNSTVRPLDVDQSECYAGYNFDLELDRLDYRRRRPFDLIATAPNGAAIRGYAQYLASDGSISTLIQAGSAVYDWDGASSFTAVGSCSASARLRGPRHANFDSAGFVIITDLEKQEDVMTWDGTTYQALAHNLTGSLQAKYCHVHNERAIFGNVANNGTDTPHVVLASAVGDPEDLTAGDRPSSSIGLDAAWFLPISDLRPINGIEHGFGQLVISTENGSLHRLNGTSSFDYSLEAFYDGSHVGGDEAMVNIGNDIVLALPGRVETLSGTINFGDVQTDDISAWIKPDVDSVTAWTVVYDQRLQRVYFFPDSLARCWVLHKSLLSRATKRSLNYDKRDVQQPGLSPWSLWQTDHSIGMQPVTAWSMLDPVTGLEYVYMGDESGRILRMEGTGDQDGGSASITASRTSRIFRVPDGVTFDVTGWITYTKAFATTVTLTFLHGGIAQFDQQITIQIPADSTVPVYNGSAYYGGTTYYSATFGARLTRYEWAAAGYSSHVQCRADIAGDADFSIAEIGLRFKTSRQA